MNRTEAIRLGTDLVLNKGMSINAAAKQVGIPISSLRLELVVNPDYVKAKAEGKLSSPISSAGRDIEQLRAHPAVLAVVNDGKTYHAAAKEYGVQAPTLNRWVNSAYPEHRNREGAHKGGRKSLAEQTAPFIDVLLGYVRDTASTLDLPPEKLIKLMSKRLEEAA